MKHKNNFFHFFKLSALMIASVATLWACDKVNVNPADFDNNVTGEFSATPESINKGDGSKLTWSIDDPDGVVKNVRLTGGNLDTSKSVSSSEMVYPEVSTRYHLQVTNADGDLLKSLQIYVTVLDPDTGLAIPEDATTGGGGRCTC